MSPGTLVRSVTAETQRELQDPNILNKVLKHLSAGPEAQAALTHSQPLGNVTIRILKRAYEIFQRTVINKCLEPPGWELPLYYNYHS